MENNATGGRNAPVTTRADWRKSSFCGSNACVEVARDGDDYLMRDSKNPRQPALRFTKAEWVAFLSGIRPGQLGVM
jgi:hypothetical protein